MQARQQGFPLQQPTYTIAEVHAHVAADHPQCHHCGTRFYDEELHGLHMMEVHPYCELCDEDFMGPTEFTEHLRLVPGLCAFRLHDLWHARVQSVGHVVLTCRASNGLQSCLHLHAHVLIIVASCHVPADAVPGVICSFVQQKIHLQQKCWQMG